MAWTDSLFTGHDLAKLNFLLLCCGASYQGGRAGIEQFVGTPVIQLSTNGLPNAYSFSKDGDQLILIDGTTSPAQLIGQALGWQNPSPFAVNGLVNAFHLEASARVFNASPASPALVFGHSMGGSLAALVCRALAVIGGSTRAITFAAPRPVNEFAATQLQWPPQRHYRLLLDPVPLIPADGVYPVNWMLPPESFSLSSPGVLPVTNPASNAAELSVLLGQYQDFYHAVSAYAAATAGFPLPTYLPAATIGGNQMIVRFNVHASLHGQYCNNSIDYLVPDGVGLQTLVLHFREQWGNQVCPKVTTQYAVIRYEGEKLGGAQFNVAGDPTQGSKYVWSQRRIWAAEGHGSFGGLDEQTFPSHDAVGIVKVCDEWLSPAGVAVTGTVPAPKGGALGISGIPESSTDKDENGNNELKAAEKTSWRNVAEQLRTFVIDGNQFRMVVLTNIRDGAALVTGNPAVASFNYSLVRECVVNPFLTTRVSRKQQRNKYN